MNVFETEKNAYEKIKPLLKSYIDNVELNRYKAYKMQAPNDVLSINLFNMYDSMFNSYNKHKNNPYFAKLEFLEDKNDNVSKAYIGKIGYVNLNENNVILDWRTPFAELYYRGKLGKTGYHFTDEFGSEEFVSGNLNLKRFIEFDGGKVTNAFDITNEISGDTFLLPYLSKDNEGRLKNIISTIQEKQDEAIRIPLNNNIIFQGCAGSGKSTVALHRLSYLIFNNAKTIKASSYTILSPNKLFISYIDNLIKDLDAEESESLSIEQVLLSLVSYKYKVLRKDEMFENLTKNKISTGFLKFKGSEEFLKCIDNFVGDVYKDMFEKDIKFNNIVLFDKDYVFETFKQNKKQSLSETLAFVIKRLNFIACSTDFVKEKIRNMYAEKQITFEQKMEIDKLLYKNLTAVITKNLKKSITPVLLYKEFLKNIEKYTTFKCDKLVSQTLKNLSKNIIAYDDIGAVLYFCFKLCGNNQFDYVKHILIDEAQDYSYLQFKALKLIFKNATFSIFGDIAQSIYSYQSISSWNEIIPVFDAKYFTLNKSYRSTIQITDCANKTLEKLEFEKAENVSRAGEEVDFVETKNVKESLKTLIENHKKSSLSTLAIICKNQSEVELVESMDFHGNIYTDNESAYNENFLSVLTVETSKGLEFDSVILFNENSYGVDALELKKQYVAKTRALHKLTILKH